MISDSQTQVPIFWLLKKDFEMAMNFPLATMCKLMGLPPNAELCGYHWTHPMVPQHITLFVDTIHKYAKHPASITSVYQSDWAPFVHTLLHEMCHAEGVDAILAKTRPNEDAHHIIELFVCDKLLKPLEQEMYGDEFTWKEIQLHPKQAKEINKRAYRRTTQEPSSSSASP